MHDAALGKGVLTAGGDNGSDACARAAAVMARDGHHRAGVGAAAATRGPAIESQRAEARARARALDSAGGCIGQGGACTTRAWCAGAPRVAAMAGVGACGGALKLGVPALGSGGCARKCAAAVVASDGRSRASSSVAHAVPSPAKESRRAEAPAQAAASAGAGGGVQVHHRGDAHTARACCAGAPPVAVEVGVGTHGAVLKKRAPTAGSSGGACKRAAAAMRNGHSRASSDVAHAVPSLATGSRCLRAQALATGDAGNGGVCTTRACCVSALRAAAAAYMERCEADRRCETKTAVLARPFLVGAGALEAGVRSVPEDAVPGRGGRSWQVS